MSDGFGLADLVDRALKWRRMLDRCKVADAQAQARHVTHSSHCAMCREPFLMQIAKIARWAECESVREHSRLGTTPSGGIVVHHWMTHAVESWPYRSKSTWAYDVTGTMPVLVCSDSEECDAAQVEAGLGRTMTVRDAWERTR